MAALREVILRRLQERLPEVPEPQLEEYLDRAAEYFFAKTKRMSVPLSAGCLWFDMALRLHSVGSGEAAGRVTSVKRGDTSIQYSDSQVAEAMTDIEGRVLLYRVVRMV